jgi:signal peptidase II
MKKPFVFGLLSALLTTLADQASKWALIAMIRPEETIHVTSFFNFVMWWNKGVSFGLFPAGSEGGMWLLIGVAGTIMTVLLLWLRRVQSRGLAVVIGLIIGGAFGNVVDRLRFGAVADFFDFHLGIHHFAAFNIADSAICIGVFILCLDSLTRKDTH